jgi:hypothetical protein
MTILVPIAIFAFWLLIAAYARSVRRKAKTHRSDKVMPL